MLKSTENKGFQMTFTNGYTISVQFGRGNYCEHKTKMPRPYKKAPSLWESKDAEIAVFDPKGNCIALEGTNYALGYLNADEVAQWIDKVSKF